MSKTAYSAQQVNITNCDREPIHIIGKAQEHGVIVVCDLNSFHVSQCSENIEDILGIPHANVLGLPLKQALSKKVAKSFKKKFRNDESLLPEKLKIGEQKFLCIPSISGDHLIIDVEPSGKSIDPIRFQEQLTKILTELDESESVNEMCQQAALLVKHLFDYDRIMIYKFDEEWNGEVVAEVKEPELESWLGLHYPATDIPKPAREIFMKQGVRIISDVHYKASPITPEISPLTGQPLDISNSELRAVSPIHIEYLQNMKVGASLTAAIVLNGELWGLVACHHYSPKFINYHQRQSCLFLTQVFSNKLALKTTKTFLENTAKSDEVRKKLVLQMTSIKNIADALYRFDPKFTDIIECSGGALVMDGEIYLAGVTPTRTEIKQLCDEILAEKEVYFSTKSLLSIYPKAKDYKNKASGILSVQIGEQDGNYIMWFRPEAKETVSWGGNPEKKAYVKDGVEYLTPRKSFERWTEKVAGVAKAWEEYDFEAVGTLRESIVHVLVKQQKDKIDSLNEQLLEANKELETFSYSVSHDLRAPLRGIDGYARILRDHYMDRLDGYSQKAVNTIVKSASEMDTLIDDILSYSRVGQTQLSKQVLSMKQIVENALDAQNAERNYPRTTIKIAEKLPKIMGDRRMISQLVNNLISNALKYSGKKENPVVEIGFDQQEDEVIYFIKDNGVGFDPKHKDKIFEVFSRVATDDFTGSGIGLSIAKKVVDKHKGALWVETIPGEGSTFYFSLPDIED
ncbi:bacteriophytochrome [Zunongwangia profunda SM-A87]|uniref:histidine kinase n=1 Tax=Zunongwangia profunda (strain DSM 18752 / CCTCC AB 206139 / SM-A87) TaxID=655815 RepID=D5BC06_ZUNPS|nr:ATP-binding protein [Zunongwangia profunda]ADF52605.1 bacteriophytochrome [Zunongwangia profunda SM-A87]